MNKLVSVCLATYNGERYLKEQIESIIKQTYKNINIIVQDDCSSDDSVDILEFYKDKIDITIYKNEQNLGYIKNFESLIQKADGDFIAICDQDDIWEVNKIELLLQELNSNTLIYSNSILVDEKGISLHKTLSQKLKNNFICSNTALNFLYDNSVSAHAMLFRRELLDYIIPFVKTLYFDNFIAATASSLNGIKYIDSNLVNYRQHSSNTLGNKKSVKKSVKNKIVQKIEKKQEEVKNIIIKIDDMMQVKTLNQEEIIILKNLKDFYLDYSNRWFNINMFLFLLKHRDVLFAITKKNSIILSLKKSIGYKLYKAVPIL